MHLRQAERPALSWRTKLGLGVLAGCKKEDLQIATRTLPMLLSEPAKLHKHFGLASTAKPAAYPKRHRLEQEPGQRRKKVFRSEAHTLKPRTGCPAVEWLP